MAFQVYVINMSSSVERLEFISSQLNYLKLPYKRIPGINVTVNEDLKKKYYSKKLNSQKYHIPLTDGEIGCYIAQRNAWKEIIKDGVDYGLVLEDDIFLKNDLKLILDNIEDLKIQWHILKLTDLKESPRKAMEIGNFNKFKLVSYLKPPTLSCADLVSKEGAARLLDLSNPFGRPVDVDKQWFIFEGIKIYGLKPYSVETNDEFESVIDNFGNRREKLNINFKIKRELKRLKQSSIYKFKILFRKLKNLFGYKIQP